MNTPNPPARTQATHEELYDVLHPSPRERVRVLALVTTMAAGIAIAACSIPAADPIPVRICGTTTAAPIRLADDVCISHGAPDDGTPVNGPAGTGPIRWLYADPPCLDASDRTKVGGPVNDDYLEPCDEPSRRKATATPTRKASPTTTPKPTPRPRATPPA